MNRNSIVTILLLLCAAVSGTAQTDSRARMDWLFREAEQCYLVDDYRQLHEYMAEYETVFGSCQQLLGDTAEVYAAYYDKMCGSYYYGLSDVGDTSAVRSEAAYLRSLQVFNRRNNNVEAAVLHRELAQLYYKIKDYAAAYAHLDTVYQYYDERVNGDGIESERDDLNEVLSQLAMCNARLGRFDQALQQVETAERYYRMSKTAAYYELLRKKGKILMMQTDAVGGGDYRAARNCYERYVSEQKAVLADRMVAMNDDQRSQYWLAFHRLLYDCCRLGSQAPELLYDVALFCKDYLVRPAERPVTWKEVRRELAPDACALEFLQYFGRDDERRLGCLVLQSSGRPCFVDLFSSDSLLSVPLTDRLTVGDALSSASGAAKDTLYNSEGLASLVWNKPLLQAVGNARRVYFAPDGILHEWAIEYLMPDTAKTCYRLSSTRNIKRQSHAPSLADALLCGGIAYGATIHSDGRDNDAEAYRFLSSQSTVITPLPGSRQEVEAIRALRGHPADVLLTGSEATDENFLRLLRRGYGLVHLSTHGYYGGQTGVYNDLKPLLHDNVMSKSGLIFAGATNTLADRQFVPERSDGILSAAELAREDLSRAGLVVLSACQTGIGRLTDDGVYGLQRGLKQAGAHAVILSLWNVNDHACSLLMRYFYENLERQPSAKNLHTAFFEARRRLMAEEETTMRFDASTLTMKGEKHRYDAPRYANPFILIDAY